MKKSKKLFFLGLIVLLIFMTVYTVYHERLSTYFLLIGTIITSLCWMTAAQVGNGTNKKRKED